MALPSSDQGRVSITRRMAIGAGFGMAAFALAATGAGAQVLQTKNTVSPGQQTASLAKHCDDIGLTFKQLAKFTGEYRQRAHAFVDGGCVGAVPTPKRGDAHNIQQWNGAAYLLHANGIELN